MKFLVSYELAADGLPKAMANFPAHRARLIEFKSRGVLLMAGPYANPAEGALAIFTTREAAEEFVLDDPFVVSGAVARYTIKDWNEALA
ncbi:MAG TPA: YciI family protein [Xanthomonadaceae bacterium]|jgi:uncharacterized protein YciI|nr:YciI family protein [Xanthomonadaceae bacterium]